MENENKYQCSEMCKYKDECPHNKGIHYNVWGEGIECMESQDNRNDFYEGKTDLPW